MMSGQHEEAMKEASEEEGKIGEAPTAVDKGGAGGDGEEEGAQDEADEAKFRLRVVRTGNVQVTE